MPSKYANSSHSLETSRAFKLFEIRHTNSCEPLFLSLVALFLGSVFYSHMYAVNSGPFHHSHCSLFLLPASPPTPMSLLRDLSVQLQLLA